MNILLDTCTFIWLRTKPDRLSPTARKLINEQENILFLSSMSIWEINIKVKIGKLKIKGDLDQLTDIKKYKEIITVLDFDEVDARQISKIDLLHRDPFDLMLISQAMTNSLAILTPDEAIKKYKLKTLW